MRAILVAAGYGTRLRPLTNHIPKCLVPIKGRPLLDIWLRNLTQAQVGPFIVNTHYMAEQVEAYVAASSFKNLITLQHEPSLLGTAGTLIENASFFEEEDGLLIHADNYTETNLKLFLNAHKMRPKECVITMMTFRTSTPSSCGIVEIDSRGVLINFHEKVEHPPGDLANGAVYVLSNELINELIDLKGNFVDFSSEIIPRYIGKIYTYETNEIFMDIGTPEAYELANQLAK